MAQGGWSALAAGIAATGQMAGAFATQAFNQHNMYKQYKYNKASMKYQYNLQRKANRIAYSDTMYSMRNAGLNPMLAYANGTVSQNVGAGSSVSSSTPNVDLDVSSALSYGLERQHMKNETKSTEQDIDTSKSQERLNDKSADKLDKDIETQNINNEIALMSTAKQIELTNQQIENLKQDKINSIKNTNANVRALDSSSAKNYSDVNNNPTKLINKHIIEPFTSSKSYKVVKDVFSGIDKGVKKYVDYKTKQHQKRVSKYR